MKGDRRRLYRFDENRMILDSTISEDQWQRTILELAVTHGWRVAHFRPAGQGKNWRTPVAAQGKGFVDLFMAKPGHYPIAAELKTESGTLRPDQKIWKEVLEKSLGVRYQLWRPRDYETAKAMLEEPEEWEGEGDGSHEDHS